MGFVVDTGFVVKTVFDILYFFFVIVLPSTSSFHHDSFKFSQSLFKLITLSTIPEISGEYQMKISDE